MSFTSNDSKELLELTKDDPKLQTLIQRLMDSQHNTLSKISHELRNPLALVSSSLQLLESTHPEVTSFKYWNSIHSDLEYMNQLLTELSAYNNSVRLHKESFSSLEFLQKICLSFAASCVDTDIEFTSKLAPDLPLFTGDPVKLKEMLLNLLKNAKDATPHGHIYLDAQVSEQMWSISITDDGCPIPSEHLEDIFDAFVTYKTNGTGLGLSIAKQVAEAHNGSISVISNDCLTTFTVKLPIVHSLQDTLIIK